AGHVAMYRRIDDLPSMAIIEAQDRLTTPTPSVPVEGEQVAPVSRRAAREQSQSRPPRTASGGRGSTRPPPAPASGGGRRCEWHKQLAPVIPGCAGPAGCTWVASARS